MIETLYLLTPHQAPLALDIHSPMDLVYECFVKLGLRYVCVTKEGHFAGIVSPYFLPSPFASYLLPLTIPYFFSPISA